jgi:hypothetical protein
MMARYPSWLTSSQRCAARAQQDVVAAAQTARCVITITAIADARGATPLTQENNAMTNSRTYEGWWDLSLNDDRNDRPLLAAFVAVWAVAVLFALV